MLVYGAFSVEITIKAILANNDIEYGKEYNLVVLFELLPKDIQKKIWDWVCKKRRNIAIIRNEKKSWF